MLNQHYEEDSLFCNNVWEKKFKMYFQACEYTKH